MRFLLTLATLPSGGGSRDQASVSLRSSISTRIPLPGVTVVLLWLALSTTGTASSQTAATPAFPCFKHHGRLASYSSGSPSLRIWLIGTKRVVGLEDSTIPPAIEPFLSATSPAYSFIYGDFELCPIGPDKPGQMRRVRMVRAENLVVENAQGLPLPPFRLLSTWPKQNTATPPKAP